MVMTARVLGCPLSDLFDGIEEGTSTEVPFCPAGPQSDSSLRAVHLLDTIPREQRDAVLSLIRALAVPNTTPDADG